MRVSYIPVYNTCTLLENNVKYVDAIICNMRNLNMSIKYKNRH